MTGRTVLIHRQGRLGDTLVALPALRLVARAFADWNRVLLCDASPSPATSMPALLDGAGLFDAAITYPAGSRNPSDYLSLLRRIRALRPEAVVFLTEWRPPLTAWRDLLFFRLCGIQTVIGAPQSPASAPRHDAATGSWERESHRLARMVSPLGAADLDNPDSWRLAIGDDVRRDVARMLDQWPGGRDFIIVSAGARVASKDWGEDNWRHLLRRLGGERSHLGLAFTGGPADQARSARLAAHWPGPVLDCCGQSPQSLAVLAAASRLMITTDGGPMHVAASAGAATIALFSGVHRPGQWSPHGDNHAVLSHGVACAPCGHWRCPLPGHPCMNGIGVDTVLAACLRRLDSTF